MNTITACGLRRLLVAAALFPCVSHAFPIFFDSFDVNTVGPDQSPVGWEVTNGTVDIIGPGFADLYPGNGQYIDLDGSSFNAGTMITQSEFTLDPADIYTFSFELGGSQRGETNSVHAGIDLNRDGILDIGWDFTLPSATPLTVQTLQFTVPYATSVARILFDHEGGDNFGLVLDDVSLAGEPIPLPGTAMLLFFGIALLRNTKRLRPGGVADS